MLFSIIPCTHLIMTPVIPPDIEAVIVVTAALDK